MALFDDMVSNVYVITNRPDLVAETKSQLKKAAIKLHGSDLYSKDLKSVIVTLPTSTTYRYSIDTSDVAVFPRFRKLHVIKDYNSPLTGYERKYNLYDVADVIDDYNLERTNYAYQAGLTIQLNATCNLNQVIIWYYQFPDTNELTFSSWIATLSSAYLEEEAARSIFKMIGKDEEYQKYEGICNDNLAAIRMAGIP